MNFDELKAAFKSRPADLGRKAYAYGYDCGKRLVLNFELLKQAFYNYNFTKQLQLEITRKILKGFQKGSSE